VYVTTYILFVDVDNVAVNARTGIAVSPATRSCVRSFSLDSSDCTSQLSQKMKFTRTVQRQQTMTTYQTDRTSGLYQQLQ